MNDSASTHLDVVRQPDPHLDQWIEKAAANPLHLAAMWRAMQTAELHVIVPCDPESEGEIELAAEESLPVVTLEESEGVYAPVFTRLEDAESTVSNLGDAYGVASAAGGPVFVMLAGTGYPIVINPFSSPRLKIDPRIVHELAATGHVSHRTIEMAQDQTTLLPVQSRDVPHDYLVALRGRCAAHRRVLTGLYLFHPLRTGAIEPDFREYRFILRMVQRDEGLLKEFKDAATRLLPGGMTLQCNLALESDPEAMELLDRTKPIWPV